MLKTLAGSLREYKKSSFAAIFFSGIEVIFEIVIPLCMSNLIDNGIEKSNMSMVWKFGILLLVFALLQLATGMLSAYTAAKASTGFPQTCVRICTTTCRPLLFPTSTVFPRHPSLPV